MGPLYEHICFYLLSHLSSPLYDLQEFCTIGLLFFFLSGLFSALDIHSNLGVISYGVSMTTLEDVFLKLEVEAEIDQAGKNRAKNISQLTGQDKQLYKQINYVSM